MTCTAKELTIGKLMNLAHESSRPGAQLGTGHSDDIGDSLDGFVAELIENCIRERRIEPRRRKCNKRPWV
jgi:hypothetical protein